MDDDVAKRSNSIHDTCRYRYEEVSRSAREGETREKAEASASRLIESKELLTEGARLHKDVEPNNGIGESLDHLFLLEDLVLNSKLVRPESLAARGKERRRRRVSFFEPQMTMTMSPSSNYILT